MFGGGREGVFESYASSLRRWPSFLFALHLCVCVLVVQSIYVGFGYVLLVSHVCDSCCTELKMSHAH